MPEATLGSEGGVLAAEETFFSLSFSLSLLCLISSPPYHPCCAIERDCCLYHCFSFHCYYYYYLPKHSCVCMCAASFFLLLDGAALRFVTQKSRDKVFRKCSGCVGLKHVLLGLPANKRSFPHVSGTTALRWECGVVNVTTFCPTRSKHVQIRLRRGLVCEPRYKPGGRLGRPRLPVKNIRMRNFFLSFSLCTHESNFLCFEFSGIQHCRNRQGNSSSW